MSVCLFLYLPYIIGNVILANKGFVGWLVCCFKLFFLSFPPFAFWLFDIGSCDEAQVGLTLWPTESWGSKRAVRHLKRGRGG